MTTLALSADQQERVNTWCAKAARLDTPLEPLPLDAPDWAVQTTAEWALSNPASDEVVVEWQGKAWQTDGAAAQVTQTVSIQVTDSTDPSGRFWPAGEVDNDPPVVRLWAGAEQINIDVTPETAEQLSIAIKSAVQDMRRRESGRSQW
jgi:hypothetical protein